MNASELIGHLIVGGIVLLLGFFGWLFKQSIYGELNKVKESMDHLERNLTHAADKVRLQAERDVNEAKAIASTGLNDLRETIRRETDILKTNYVPIQVCNAEREGCQSSLVTKIEVLGEKMDLVLRRQTEVISRMDHHINGSHKDGKP